MDDNELFLQNVTPKQVPWPRLTTAYGRATAFPRYFQALAAMNDRETIKTALAEIGAQIEHQGTLWHATPLAMVFLTRIFAQAAAEMANNETARWLVAQLLDLFVVIAQCFHEVEQWEHAAPLPHFADLLREEYLWSEDYDEDDDALRYEEDEVFPEDLFYSFYYYAYQALLSCRPWLERLAHTALAPEAAALSQLLAEK